MIFCEDCKIWVYDFNVHRLTKLHKENIGKKLFAEYLKGNITLNKLLKEWSVLKVD